MGFLRFLCGLSIGRFLFISGKAVPTVSGLPSNKGSTKSDAVSCSFRFRLCSGHYSDQKQAHKVSVLGLEIRRDIPVQTLVTLNRNRNR